MTTLFQPAAAPVDASTVIRLHAAVRLCADVATPSGTIPAGTLGVVLQVFDRGAACQVEFDGPYEDPETVSASLLRAA